MRKITYFLFLVIISISCNNNNYLDRHEINVDSLKTLPDNFYAYHRGRIYLSNDKYRIWFDRNQDGNIKRIFNIDDFENLKADTDDSIIINKYKIDTLECKNIIQKFINLSKRYGFGHIKIDKKNKISFSTKEDLDEQYVIIFNDSLRNIYSNNEVFKLLNNGWFVNLE